MNITKLKDILTQLLTGKDGCTHDILRWITMFGFIGYIGLTGYSLFLGNPFSLTDFATGLATIIGAAGIGIGVKGNTEPDPINANTTNQII